jgi:4-hydroxy 2-oxovalerate aldolase
MAATVDARKGPPAGELLDATLRDGSYAVDFQFDEVFVVELLNRLDRTPIRMIEIGHGHGFEAERSGVRAGNIDLRRWCEIARSALTASAWGMFAQPGFSRLSTLVDLTRAGMSFVRVGLEAHRAPAHLDYLRGATERCDQVYLNLMKSSDTPPEALPGLLGDIPAALAGVYVVDSYGAMLPADVRRYVRVLTGMFPVVGFHGHDNLGLANANCLAALEAGAALVDGTLAGIGRGAGNAGTESLAGILRVMGEDRYDYRELARLAEFCHRGMDVLPEDRAMQVLGAVIGIHSGYFPLVEQLSSALAVEPATIMSAAAELAVGSPGPAELRAAAEQLTAPVGAAEPAVH